MAISATIALSPTTITAGGPGSVATVTISNGAAGGPSVPVLGIRPIVYDSGTQQSTQSFRLETVQIPGPVPFGASVTAQFSLVTGDPQTAGSAGGYPGPASLAFDVTCEILMGDGSVVIPNVATLTVNPSPHS